MIEMKAVRSSNVDSIGYDAGAKTLAVKFKNGGTYHYMDVPSEVHEQLANAESVGSTLARSVIGKFKQAKQEKSDGKEG